MGTPSDTLKVFSVCSVDWLRERGAAAFTLMQLDPEGAARPLQIFLMHRDEGDLIGYVNRCPHEGTWLNIGDGTFLSDDRAHLRCGRHKALFDIGSGVCVSGPCEGKSLEPIAVIAIRGDVCICGYDLVEADDFVDDDETMDIMVHP